MSAVPDEKSISLLTAALGWARRGFEVFPLTWPVDGVCSCGDGSCPSPGKHPMTDNGFHDATDDEARVAAWWSRWPQANIGLRTGGRVDVVDLDGADAIRAWTEFIRLHGEPSHVAVVRTGRPDGGLHLYCEPGGQRTVPRGKRGLPPGVEIKAAGGYVVAPPSRHASGRLYEWVVDLAEGHLRGDVDYPAWYAQALTPDRPQQLPPAPPTRPAAGASTTPYGRAVLTNAVDRLGQAEPGTRWLTAALDGLVTVARAITGGCLDPDEAVTALEDVARAVGLGEAEVRRLRPELDRLLAKGLTHPIGPTEQRFTPMISGLPAGPATADLPVQPPSGFSFDGPNEPPAPWVTGTDAEDPGAGDEAAQLATLTAQEMLRQRARRDAGRLLDAETFRPPVSTKHLAEELALPEEPVAWAAEKVLPAGANVLLTAGYKTGKTTLIGHLAKCLADGESFLGRFGVALGQRVGVWNYELSPGQYRRWLRDLLIQEQEAVAVLHLRGHSTPLLVPHVQDWAVAWLAERGITTWVLDPFARAFVGSGSENDNSDVGRFLDTLDVIKERSGVGQLILPAHTGRAVVEEGQERARGATRLNDWADAQWLLTKNEDSDRFFSAQGRDVDVPEEKLTYDVSTRALTMGGWDRRTDRLRNIEEQILAFVRTNPACTARDIEQAVPKSKETVGKARTNLIGRRLLHVEDGPRGSKKHFVA